MVSQPLHLDSDPRGVCSHGLATLFSPRQWFFAVLLLLEISGIVMGWLACREVRQRGLRGRGTALNAMVCPMFMAMFTFVAYHLVELFDWHGVGS